MKNVNAVGFQSPYNELLRPLLTCSTSKDGAVCSLVEFLLQVNKTTTQTGSKIAADSTASDHPECSTCREQNTRRACRKNIFERILSVAYVYPFRCHSCGKRFFKLQWRVRYRKVLQPSLYSDRGAWRLQYLIELSSGKATTSSMISIPEDQWTEETQERLVA